MQTSGVALRPNTHAYQGTCILSTVKMWKNGAICGYAMVSHGYIMLLAANVTK